MSKLRQNEELTRGGFLKCISILRHVMILHYCSRYQVKFGNKILRVPGPYEKLTVKTWIAKERGVGMEAAKKNKSSGYLHYSHICTQKDPTICAYLTNYFKCLLSQQVQNSDKQDGIVEECFVVLFLHYTAMFIWE